MKRILIVGYPGKDRDAMDYYLNKVGFSIEIADSEKKALEILNKNPIDLCITNHNYNESSEFSLIKSIQKNYSNTQIVLYAKKTILDRFNSSDMNNCYLIEKPAMLPDFMKVIDQVFKK